MAEHDEKLFEHEFAEKFRKFDDDIKIPEIPDAQSIFDRAELDKISCEILSKREKDIFSMYADGKSYAEISHSLKIGEKSVDNALFRAKKKLRAYFSGR